VDLFDYRSMPYRHFSLPEVQGFCWGSKVLKPIAIRPDGNYECTRDGTNSCIHGQLPWPANVYQHKTQRVHREFVAWLLSLVERLWKNVENCDRENGAGVALSATTMSHRRILISGPNFVGFTNFTSKVAPSKV